MDYRPRDEPSCSGHMPIPSQPGSLLRTRAAAAASGARGGATSVGRGVDSVSGTVVVVGAAVGVGIVVRAVAESIRYGCRLIKSGACLRIRVVVGVGVGRTAAVVTGAVVVALGRGLSVTA